MPNQSTIAIRLREVYGKNVAYPANEQAELLARIAGTTTLTHETLCLAERMGFEIVTIANTAAWKEVA